MPFLYLSIYLNVTYKTTEINANNSLETNIKFKNLLERFSMEYRKNNKPSSHSGQSMHRIISQGTCETHSLF